MCSSGGKTCSETRLSSLTPRDPIHGLGQGRGLDRRQPVNVRRGDNLELFV